MTFGSTTILFGEGLTWGALVKQSLATERTTSLDLALVTYGYAPAYDPGYGAWNFLAGATFGFIAGTAASNWQGGCGCCGWHGDVDIDINRNVNISRDYVQHLNVDRANLRNANINRQNFQSLSANRQDFRNNVYKNPNWSRQLQDNRRDQLNQRGERLAIGGGYSRGGGGGGGYRGGGGGRR